MSAMNSVLQSTNELMPFCETNASDKNNQNIPPGYIECAWCAKIGMRLFTLDTKAGSKAFCSELCFTQCRRASFKKTKICDWCKHVRHTVNYVDFQDGEQQLQFCSNKCLNQYKMNIFCNETKAHLHLNPNLIKDSSKLTSITKTSNLITPELWLKDLKNGDNEYNDSVNSFKGSSESDFELNLEDSASVSPQPMVSHQNKRKFSEFSKDVNEFKPNERQKVIPKKQKSNKESKSVKHSNKLSNGSSGQSSSSKHAKHVQFDSRIHMTPDSVQSNEWSSRDSNDKSSGFHSPSFRPHARHSPNPPPVPSHRTSMVAPNQNVQGNTAINRGIRTATPLNPMVPNTSPPGQIFPRLSGNTVRGAPLIPPQIFGPRMPGMPNLLGVSQMEALARMQTSFAGFRPFLPFGPPPPPPHTGFPFAGLPHMNGISPPNGNPLLTPSIQGNSSVPTQLHPNCSLLPPMTVMVPYPVPIPIPIPIPVPFLFPFDKELLYKNKDKSQRDSNSTEDVNTATQIDGTDTSNTVNSSSTTTSKIESVISKLVERKTRANSNQNNSSVSEKGLDLRTIGTVEDNVVFINTKDDEMDSEESDGS